MFIKTFDLHKNARFLMWPTLNSKLGFSVLCNKTLPKRIIL